MARKKKEQTMPVETIQHEVADAVRKDDKVFIAMQSIGFERDGVIKQIAYGQSFKESDVPERIFNMIKKKESGK